MAYLVLLCMCESQVSKLFAYIRPEQARVERDELSRSERALATS